MSTSLLAISEGLIHAIFLVLLGVMTAVTGLFALYVIWRAKG